MNKHFVSYPKSGRTWLRYILSQINLADSIQFHHDRFEFNDGACPPHDFNLEARLQAYAGVDELVYLERDPRDVMVSLYHQVTGRFKDFFNYSGTISDFIRHEYFGAHNLQAFREMWRVIADRHQFHRVTYEDCHADILGTVQKIIAYYGMPASDDALSQAIRNAEFQNMKKMELSEQFAQPWLRPRNGAPKVREGKVGGFQEALSESDILFLDQTFMCKAA